MFLNKWKYISVIIFVDVENDDPQSENNSNQTEITSKLRSATKSKRLSNIKKSNECLNESYTMPLSPDSIGSTNSLESKGILQKSCEETQHIYSTQQPTLKTPKGNIIVYVLLGVFFVAFMLYVA